MNGRQGSPLDPAALRRYRAMNQQACPARSSVQHDAAAAYSRRIVAFLPDPAVSVTSFDIESGRQFHSRSVASTRLAGAAAEADGRRNPWYPTALPARGG
jgi:hypothetical protein